ncbi:hypothetical protein PR048_003671 [Dryococelus australis]|uniref:Uncharacterized protein n=1 Tax=Dryococelus australis TaxID=614101 RepID=A0ABQ9IPN9_9NEOP|nr:hypothetical protein PR048_003671 [Dryococelus australis]
MGKKKFNNPLFLTIRIHWGGTFANNFLECIVNRSGTQRERRLAVVSTASSEGMVIHYCDTLVRDVCFLSNAHLPRSETLRFSMRHKCTVAAYCIDEGNKSDARADDDVECSPNSCRNEHAHSTGLGYTREHYFKLEPEEYTTRTQVDLKQGFRKCSFYREQPEISQCMIETSPRVHHFRPRPCFAKHGAAHYFYERARVDANVMGAARPPFSTFPVIGHFVKTLEFPPMNGNENGCVMPKTHSLRESFVDKQEIVLMQNVITLSAHECGTLSIRRNFLDRLSFVRTRRMNILEVEAMSEMENALFCNLSLLDCKRGFQKCSFYRGPPITIDGLQQKVRVASPESWSQRAALRSSLMTSACERSACRLPRRSGVCKQRLPVCSPRPLFLSCGPLAGVDAMGLPRARGLGARGEIRAALTRTSNASWLLRFRRDAVLR